jgi:hypothetical protein
MLLKTTLPVRVDFQIHTVIACGSFKELFFGFATFKKWCEMEFAPPYNKKSRSKYWNGFLF